MENIYIGMSSKEFIALMRKEIEEINNMKPESVEEIYIEDKETKRREKILVKSTDLIAKALLEKKQRNLVSRLYNFEHKNILTYSEANDYKLKGTILQVKHSEKYNAYCNEISEWFKINDKDGMLTYFLKQNKIMISLKFKLVNTKKDIDNVLKPFIDCLFFNVNDNDNKVKRLLTSVEKSYTGKDSVDIQIVTLRDIDWEQGLFIENTEYKKSFEYESIF